MHLDIFVSRASIVTSRGLGFFELSLDTQPELKVDRFLPDRKVGKTLSSAACWGLASINALKDDLKLLPHLDPYRRGLFVAAPPPYTSDKCSYNESILESSKNLTDPLQVFGRIFDAASPTTALMGLPNGLTCFGARILDARGPHGTYVGREASVHTAVSAAVTHLRLGRIDNFIVAGFVNTSEEFFTESLFDFLNKKSGVPIPRTCTGGFASFLSSRIEDFNGVEPMAVLTSVSQCQSTVANFPDVVLMSSLLPEQKNGFRTFYSECPVIDVFSIYPYYAELSGLIEIEIARQMAKAGEIPATAKGLIICSDIFGNTSFLEFRLNEELN